MQRQRCLRPQAHEGFQLQGKHLHLAFKAAAACLQAVHLDTQQTFFQRRRGPLAHTCAEEAQGIAVHLQQFLGKVEVALCGQELPGLHPHLRPQSTLPVRHLGAFHLQLACGHSNAPGFSAVEIQRQGYARREVVVRAGHILLHAEIEHGIRAQPGLAESSVGGVHLSLRGLQVRVVRQGTRHEVVHRDLPRPTWGLAPPPDASDQGHPEEPDQQDVLYSCTDLLLLREESGAVIW